MSGISFSGLGSGLPIEDIVKATLAAEAAPKQRLVAQKALAQEQFSALGQLTSRLDALGTAMSKLKGAEKFELISAKSTNDKAFTATASNKDGAVAGNYNVEVLQKADNYRWVSDSMDSAGTFSGEITIAGTTIQTGTIAEPWSLDQLRQAINSNEDLAGKVSANIVNVGSDQSRLVINSLNSGEEGRVAVDLSTAYYSPVNGDPAIAIAGIGTDIATSLDAKIKIDGIEATSSTNKFKDVVSGVTININQDAEIGSSGSLRVGRDDAAIRDKIEEFTKAYNDVVIHLNEAKKGPLGSSGVIRSIEGMLRDTLTTPTGSKTDIGNTLASIGISSFVEKGWEAGTEASSRNGTLEIDSAKLTKMLSEDFEKVAFIFGNEETGYAKRFEDLSKQLTRDSVVNGELSKGIISTQRTGLTAKMGRLDDRMIATDYRLELLEARLYKQFNAADAMSAQFQAMGSYITQQFEGLAGYTRK